MSLIGKFAHLPGRPRSGEAMPLLEKIASQVKPIMKKRGWKVGVLGEFFPDNPALLGINMNHGQRINLRLRPHGTPSTFYDLEQLVLVMLHELTHIVHGPHDASFYKLLAELEEEYYDLKRKGYSGEGFHSDGKRLQGNRLNEYEGRKRGLAAAEKRYAQQRVMGRGGVLGGSSTAGKSMREIVAEAAERRLADDKTCKVDTKEAEEEDRKAQEQSVVIDATGDSDHDSGDSDHDSGGEASKKRPLAEADATGSADAPIVIDDDSPATAPPPTRPRPTRGANASPSASSSKTVSAASSSPATPALPPSTAPITRPPADKSKRSQASSVAPTSASSSRPKIPIKSPPAAPTEWTCGTCTLINPMSARACDACQSPRPVQQIADAWYCEFCGAGPREMEFWSCIECGWVRKWG